jgi:hypothetical protein
VNDERDAGWLPGLAIVLGILGILSGFAGNSAVLLLGAAAVVLGLWAQSNRRRNIAWWGIVCGAVSVIGYIGIVAGQPS